MTTFTNQRLNAVGNSFILGVNKEVYKSSSSLINNLSEMSSKIVIEDKKHNKNHIEAVITRAFSQTQAKWKSRQL
ncbi:hypothetical protein NUACC21_02510 [Scytonema sp. NUACC21]